MIIDIAILCPIEVEFNIIRKILLYPKSTQYQHLSFELGQIEGKKIDWNVAIIEPDHNLNSFTLKTKEVISILNPKYLILAGVAGGIKDPKLGDIVVGTKSYLYEGGKETDEGFVSRPRVVENSSNELLTLAKRTAREVQIEDTVFHFGPIASGNKVLANLNSKAVENIKKHYNDTQAVEMEAYEFTLTASRSGIPYLNVRGISDLIESKSKSDAKGYQSIASKRVALFIKQLLSNLSPPQKQLLYTSKIHLSYEKKAPSFFRKTKLAVIQFKDDLIELSFNQKEEIIRNILEIEHLKMPEELSKSWVRIKYLDKNTEKELYFSDSFPIGLGSWIGGSKQLLKQFKIHQNKQISYS